MTDHRVGISFVGDVALAMRIHEVLDRTRFRIRFYSGPKSRLRRSRFVDEFIPVGAKKTPTVKEVVDAAQTGLLVADDWMAYSTDQMLFGLRQALPHHPHLAPLVPVGKEKYWHMLGSKIGLAEVLEELELPTPPTRVAHTETELREVLARLEKPALIKGEQGGGGFQVKRVEPGEKPQVPDSWFPVIVQDFVEGALISVEAVFRHGDLVSWQYSRAVSTAMEFGWTTVRDFIEPPRLDALETLSALGEKAGLHGFANCSFIWDNAKNEHLLFEVDLRANRWHHLAPKLGINLSARMTGDEIPPITESGSRDHERIHLFSRHIEQALKTRNYETLRPWLRREPGTWEWRSHADSAVNWREFKAFLRALFP